MKTLVRLSSFLAAWFFLHCIVACSEDQPQAVLNESEIAFDERLASISSDPTDDSRFFIGTEDGMVIFYNSKDNSVRRVLTDYDRIYRIVPDIRAGQDSVFWVGVRNMGLFRCRLNSDSLQTMNQYCIPAKDKETKFSAYDICFYGDKLLVSTSHGLFSLENDSDSMMRPICVLQDPKEKGYLSPLVYSNMVMTRDSSVYCASAQGLIRYSTVTGDTVCIPEDVKNIVMRGDSIMALTEHYLYIYDHSSNKVIEKIGILHPAQIFYYEPTMGVNYFISDNSIQIVEDKNLNNPGEYKEIRLRRTTRPTTCHNIIVNNPLRQQSILLTNNSLLQIGYHQDAFNSFGRIDHACVDGNNIYYLLGRKLYRQNTVDKDAPMDACQIKDLGRDIRFMTVKDDEMYYVDNDNNCFHAPLFGSYFWNSLWSWEHSLPKPEKEVTAIGKDTKGVYIGVRDGFCRIEEPGKDIKLTHKDPFITAFSNDDQRNLVFSTLNDGIYRSSNDSFVQMDGTDDHQFIRDMAISDGKTYFLSNRFLFCLDKNGMTNIIDTAACFSRILTTEGHLYGVGYRGLHDFTTGRDLFIDVVFNPKACVTLNGKVYCGSGNGVYVLEEHGQSISNARTVKFKSAFKPFSRTNLAIILFVLLTITIGLLWYDRYRISRRAMLSHKSDLVNRIATLNMAREFLNSKTIDLIDHLSEEVTLIDVAKGRKSLEEVHRLSKEIQAVTASVPLELIPKLQKLANKIEKENTKEGVEYIKASEEDIATHSISKIVFQLKGCSNYLQKLEEAKQKVEYYTTLLVYSLASPYSLNLDATTPKVKTIALDSELSPIEQLSQIEAVITQLTTAEGKDTVAAYLKTKMDEVSKTARGSYGPQMTCIYQEYKGFLSQLNIVGTMSDMDRLLRDILLNNQRLFLIQELIAMNTIILDTYGRKKEIEKERAEDSRKGVIDPWRAEKRYKEEDRICSDFGKVSHKIQKSEDRFYQCIWQCKDGQILQKIDLKDKNQEGKILPLLLAIPKELFPFDRYCELIGGNQKSLYRAKTKLVGLLSIISEEAKDYSTQNPSSIISLITKLNGCISEE